MQVIYIIALKLQKKANFLSYPSQIEFDMGRIFFWETILVTILILSKGKFMY